ncbi:MAG: hypothetical protein ABI689_02460 [Thermoanaerobaculia bacterium]
MTFLRAACPTLLVICSLAIGCFGGSRPQKTPGSALWISAESGELGAEAQSRLAAFGVKEVFLDAAEIEWAGNPRLRRLAAPTLPRGTPTTLVVSGRWSPGDHPPDGLATAMLAELAALRVEAEQRGLVIVGYHFEVEAGDKAESLGKTLGRLRTLLGSKYFVSAGFGRKALAEAQAKTIAAGVDFVVGMIYGQRPGEPEDPTAWDLESVEESFRRLEGLERPYFTGAVTLGTAALRARGGETRAVSTAFSLGDLIQTRNLELKPGFSLQGIDRQVWEFVARGPAHAGPWDLAPGESIRVVRTATPFLEEFRRRLGAWESTHRLGDVLYRLRRDDERLSLSVDNFADVFAPDAAAPVLDLSLEKVAASGSRWVVKVRLANRSSESTDLAYFDSNFVQLQVSGATIGDVAPGEFQRIELLVDGEKGTMRAFREANTVRFYLPLLEENHEVASGNVELKLAQRKPRLAVSASFLLADGRDLTIEPQDWQFEKP